MSDERWKLYDKNSFDEDVELLGKLASHWRDKHRVLCGEAISSIKYDYEQAVKRLINSGKWFDMPPFEDQLPDDMMPQIFFDYWSVERKPRQPIKQEDIFQTVVDFVVWVLFIVFVIWVVVSCGGCFQAGSRIFLK